MFKKLLALTIFTSTLTLPLYQANASTNVNPTFDNNDVLNSNELEAIRNSEEEYTIPLTYEQAVERTAEMTNKTITEVKGENPEKSNVRMLASTAAASGNVCGWQETSTNVTVKSSTQKLIVILKSCRNGSFGWIEKKKKPMLQEFKASGGKSFAGTIKVDLNDNGFYYVANGNFYNGTTVTHSRTTGVTTVFTATYNVAATSNHYASIYTGLKWRKVTN